MKDLLETLREFRLKLYGLEALLEAEGGRRTEAWFTGVDPPDDTRKEATTRLIERGLREPKPAPQHFGLTDRGQRLLANTDAQPSPGPVPTHAGGGRTPAKVLSKDYAARGI